MPLALDGSVLGSAGAATLALPILTTANTNDVIIVSAITNAGPITSITATGLTFVNRHVDQLAGAGFSTETWRAIAAAAFTGVITLHTAAGSYVEACAFGISGAVTASPFDPNVGLPVASTTGPLTMNTTNSHDFCIGVARTPVGGAGGSWIGLGTAGFLSTFYQIVSAPQSGLSFGSAGGGQVLVGDAVTADLVSPVTFRKSLSAFGTRVGSRQLIGTN